MKGQTKLQKKGAAVMRRRTKAQREADSLKSARKETNFEKWAADPAAADLATSSGRYAGVDNKAAPARYGKGHKRLNPGVSSAPRKRKAVAVVMPSGAVVAVKARKPLSAKQLAALAAGRAARSAKALANAPPIAKLAATAAPARPANPYDMSMSGSGFNEATRTGNPYLSGL